MGFAIKSLGGIVSPSILSNTLLQENLFIATQRLTWPHVHSRDGLGRLLESFFKTKVDVQEFIGGWNQARPEDLSYLGNKKGQYNCLGSNLILGQKSWQQNKAIKIILGPLGWDAYKPLTTLLTNNRINVLRDMAYVYAGLNTKIEAVIKLKPQEIQFIKLGQNYELGRTTWLYCDKKETLKPFCKITLKQPFTGAEN
jgi:predicted component of type VI protein secretion system